MTDETTQLSSRQRLDAAANAMKALACKITLLSLKNLRIVDLKERKGEACHFLNEIYGWSEFFTQDFNFTTHAFFFGKGGPYNQSQKIAEAPSFLENSAQVVGSDLRSVFAGMDARGKWFVLTLTFTWVDDRYELKPKTGVILDYCSIFQIARQLKMTHDDLLGVLDNQLEVWQDEGIQRIRRIANIRDFTRSKLQ